MKLDNADMKILSAVQKNSRISIDSLSEIAHMSPASVQRRLKRYREAGIIAKDVSILDPTKVGQSMTFIVTVELEREQIDKIDAFTRLVVADCQVQQCYYITGDADFCIICTASDIDDFESLTHRLFFGNSNVRHFRTSVVMSRKKVGLEVKVLPTEAND